MINKNNPSVKMVTGKVKTIRIGFTIKFKSDNTMATIIEVVKLSTFTPGKNRAIIITKTAVKSILKIRFMGYV